MSLATSATLSEVRELLPYLKPEEIAELDRLLIEGVPSWLPQEGPQTEAFESLADIVGYGGAAGGGKTDLEVGLALTKHQRSIIYRKEAKQLQPVYDRVEEIIGTGDGLNRHDGVWKLPDGRKLFFGGLNNPTDYKKYQGHGHDLKCFDEATEIPEYMVRFLMGWRRTNSPDQRCRIIMAFNPPSDSDGRWVIAFFAPWLDPMHKNPAKPGELRWFTTIDDRDTEVPNGDEIEVEGEMVQPLSRTFIPSRVEDNIYYMESGYKATLQALPEPLRSQMLRGDFTAGMEEDPWQVIPEAWVRAAQDRWEPLTERKAMDSIGVDVARGGKDQTIIAPRHGNWFGELVCYPGTETPDGPLVAGLVIKERRDKAPVHIDVIGVGSSPYDFLKDDVQTIPVNGAESAKDAAGNPYTTKDGEVPFMNMRSMNIWRMRESLDPAYGEMIALPPDEDLLKDLCAPKWKFGKSGIQVESKADLNKRLHRTDSTDRGDAVCYANIDTPKECIAKPIEFTAWGG